MSIRLSWSVGVLLPLLLATLPDGLTRANAQAVDARCDLSGDWRSSAGVLELQHVEGRIPGPDVATIGRATTDAGEETRPSQPGAGVLIGEAVGPSGTLRLEGISRQGDLLLDIALEGADGRVRIGTARWSTDAACSEIAGTLSFETGDEPFLARRVSFAAGGSTLDAPSESLREDLDAVAFLRDLAATAPTIESTVAEFGGDPEALVAFVQNDIRLLPYPGSLRGSVGTLHARAGSAADQAALLASLLRAAGAEVRFAMADLTEEELAALLETAETGAPETSFVPTILPATRAEDMATLIIGGQEARRVSDALADVPFTLPATASTQRREALATHVWVQMRTAEGWIDLDPTHPAGSTWAKAQAVNDEMFPALVHRVEIRLELEQLTPEGITLSEVGAFTVNVPAIADAGTPSLAIRITPMDPIPGATGAWRLDQIATATEALQSALYDTGTTYIPSLLTSDDAVVLGQPFTIRGARAELDWRLRIGQQTGEAVQSGFESLADRIINPDAAAPGLPAISGLAVEYRIVSPGADPVTHRRWIIDHLGPALRAAGTARLSDLPQDVDRQNRIAFSADTEMLITGVAPSPDHLIHWQAASLEDEAHYMDFARAVRRGDRTASFADLGNLRFLPLELYALAMDHEVLAEGLAADLGQPLFQAAPHIMTVRSELSEAARGPLSMRTTVDLVHVPRVVLMPDAADRAALLRAQIRLGMVLTALESRMAQRHVERICPTACARSDAPAQDAIGVVLGADRYTWIADPAEVAAEGDLAAAFEAALARGQLVIAATDASGDLLPAWVQIDPDTGATLGMTLRGGEGHTEYVIITGMILITSVVHGVMLAAEMAGVDPSNPLLRFLADFRGEGRPLSAEEVENDEEPVNPLEGATLEDFWRAARGLARDFSYLDFRAIQWVYDEVRDSFNSSALTDEDRAALERVFRARGVLPEDGQPARPYADASGVIDRAADLPRRTDMDAIAREVLESAASPDPVE